MKEQFFDRPSIDQGYLLFAKFVSRVLIVIAAEEC
jgi:hypothetical protein